MSQVKRENLVMGMSRMVSSVVFLNPLSETSSYLFASLPPQFCQVTTSWLYFLKEPDQLEGRRSQEFFDVRERQVLMVKLFFTMACKTNILHRCVILCYLWGRDFTFYPSGMYKTSGHPVHDFCQLKETITIFSALHRIFLP